MHLPAHPAASLRTWLTPSSLIVLVLIVGAADPAQSLGSCIEGSCVRILESDHDALQARIDLIAHAEHSIDVACYIIDSGEVSIAVLESLRQAAQRGVRVRVLVDGFVSRLPSDFEKYLCNQGVKMCVYHKPNECHLAWLNRRIHSKLMVVDSQVAIIGSRNLDNGHFGLDKEVNFVDCDAIVAGSVAFDSQSYFDWLWNLPDVLPAPEHDSISMDVLHCRPQGDSCWNKAWRDARSNCDYQRLLNRSIDHIQKCLGVVPISNHQWLDGATCGIDICLLHDRHPDKSARQFQRRVVCMLNSAQNCVLIETPYPAFGKAIRSAISRARMRGVCVTILTNSLATNNELSTYAAYQNQKRALLREGVKLRELRGCRSLHAKTMIIDHSTWMIGSYNFDARSDRANLELAIVSHDPAAAGLLRASVATRLARSTLIQPDTLILQVGDDWTMSKRTKLILQRTVVEAYRFLL